MNGIPIQAWDIFRDDFDTMVLLWLEEVQSRERLTEIESELRRVRTISDKSPSQELAAVRKEIEIELDAAEKEALRQVVRGSNLFGRLLEHRRDNAVLGFGGATAKTAIFSQQWRRHEAAQVPEWGPLRRLFKAALDLEQQKIDDGMVEDTSISP